MTTFQQLSISELNSAAEFISDLNSKKEHHIGFCGKEKNDIFNDLHEDFIIDGQTTVCVAFQQNEIVALIGFDIDDELAEVWGPFSMHQNIALQTELWNFAIAKFPQLTNFSFFIDEENTFQQRFMKKIDATIYGEHLYFKLAKEAFQPVEKLQCKPYNTLDFTQFIAIHNDAFPNAYYSAKTIVEKLQIPKNQLIFLRHDKKVKGYAYFEINAGLQSAHLDFFAIASEFRGRGYGELLLKEALTVIFANEEVTHVTLTVNNTNTEANRLYYKTGFLKQDMLMDYSLTI